MSRVAKKPVNVLKGTEVILNGQDLTVKGPKGSLSHKVHQLVLVKREGESLEISPADTSVESNALAGTTRAIIFNLMTGVQQGFERKLDLVGVGYRAQLQGTTLNLSLGKSHPENFEVPADIVIEVPSQTQIIVKGTDKQLVGAVAAKIRAYRPPEPYKGKGIRYSDEVIVLKETKKK